MEVSGLWRYPVKSLGAEALTDAELTADGIAGDRVVHVRGPRGVLTGRTRRQLLAIPASTAPDGVPMVGGQRWNSRGARALVQARGGADAELAAYDGAERFDILNLLVATDGAVARFGHDIRRLRPNLLISGVDADAEVGWPGHALAIGEALIGVQSVRTRCVVPSVDPDTGVPDPNVTRRLRDLFANKLALNCWVIRPGTIKVGDPARLVNSDAQPAQLGGWIVGAPYPGAGATLPRGVSEVVHRP